MNDNKELEKLREEIKRKWNNKADELNQWDSLGMDEKEELALSELLKSRQEVEQLKKVIDEYKQDAVKALLKSYDSKAILKMKFKQSKGAK